MTQPSEAVGGANDLPVVAAEPTIEDRMSAALVEGEEEEKPKEREGEEASEPELTEEDVAELEAEEQEPSPIKPPVSWTAENAEKFAELPRDVQEYISERETEREKFVQSKAQEAKQARSQAERDALTVIQNVQAQASARLQHFEQQLAVQQPDPALIYEDPELYAQQESAYRHWTAQRQLAQQSAHEAAQMAEQAAREISEREATETRELLQTEFPEYLDESKGPELRTKLGSTALALRVSADVLPKLDGNDILGLKIATEWREKAAKYDKLMAKKMETVRSARDLPRVSRPGTPQGRGAAENQRYAADREAMRQGDDKAAARAIARFL
jgi:hypothetical protein